jgi:hypothetical protein
VFTPLTCWYLRSVYGADWSCKAPIKLVEKAFAASKRDSQEEVVVLSKVRRPTAAVYIAHTHAVHCMAMFLPLLAE